MYCIHLLQSSSQADTKKQKHVNFYTLQVYCMQTWTNKPNLNVQHWVIKMNSYTYLQPTTELLL